MAEYIDRNEVMKTAIYTGLCDSYGNMYGSGDVVLADDIQAIPAADVAPVVHGRWEDVSLRFTQVKEKCTVCGGIVYAHGYKYCPNCGAKMESFSERNHG